MNEIVIFAGPSIGLAEAEEIAPFAYRPPAAQGDVYRTVIDDAKAIGLIDGYFESVPAVWHKEILFALASGVHVFGASSMGALRAAELSAYGMRGIGRIFEWYAAGTIDADDEVALVHGPAEMGYIALSVPLVNVRATLDKAQLEEAIAAGISAKLLASARTMHFKLRSWPAVVEQAGLPADEAETILRWLRQNAVDQKRLDARAMIEAMAALATDWAGPHRADFVFEPTDAWNAGVDTFELDAPIADIDRRVIDEARLNLADFNALLAAAAAAHSTATAGESERSARRQARDIDRFRSALGLQNTPAFRGWLSANALSEDELGARLAGRAAVGDLVDRSNAGLMFDLLGEIKLRGLYRDLLQRAERKAKKLATIKSADGHAGRAVSNRLLIEWFYQVRLRQPVPDDLEAARRGHALADMAEFRELMLREYLLAGLQCED